MVELVMHRQPTAAPRAVERDATPDKTVNCIPPDVQAVIGSGYG
jgi:hypothetical protein